jgi:hypothetical protein
LCFANKIRVSKNGACNYFGSPKKSSAALNN